MAQRGIGEENTFKKREDSKEENLKGKLQVLIKLKCAMETPKWKDFKPFT